MLDEFSASVMRDVMENREAEVQESKMKSMEGILDPLLSRLSDFESDEDLRHKMDEWFRLLDIDASGGISFEELRSGIKTLPGAGGLHLTRDELDQMTEQGKYLEEDGSLSRSLFHLVITRELSKLAGRNTKNMLAISESEEFKTTVLQQKLMG